MRRKVQRKDPVVKSESQKAVEPQHMNLSDRDIMIGLLNAVGALAKRLTGESMIVRVEDSQGNFVDIRPSTDKVRWVPKNCDGGEERHWIGDL